jgi:hypothetical protein
MLQQVPHLDYRIGQLLAEADNRRLAKASAARKHDRTDSSRTSRSKVTALAAALFALIIVAGVAIAAGSPPPSGAGYSMNGAAGVRYHR